MGLGSDFDGIGATPAGLENIGLLSAVTEELAARGCKDADIRKILGEYFIRVFTAVTKVVRDIQSAGKETDRER